MGLMLRLTLDAQVERLEHYAHREAWRPCLKACHYKSNAEGQNI